MKIGPKIYPATIKMLITIFVLIDFSCTSTPTDLSDNDKAAVVTEVRNTLHDYLVAVAATGLTAEFAYLDHSEEFFWVPPGFNTSISYDSVAALLTRNAPLFSAAHNSFDSLRIIPLSSKLAVYTANIRSEMIDTTGQVFSSQLVETGVVIKRVSGWKLLNGQTSLIHP
jgi:hypothetical protein